MNAILKQLHWIVGITLGTFIAISGLTGGLMAFAPEITAWATGQNKPAEKLGEAPLSVGELYRRLNSQLDGGNLVSLTVFSDPSRLAQLQVTPADAPPPGPGAPPPELRLANGYSGDLLPESRVGRFVQSAHHWIREIHQGHWFAPDNPLSTPVRAAFGAGAFSLFFFVLTGLFLRWPRGRNARSWKGWFGIDTRLKGRPFLRNLHMVMGTLVFLMFLVSAHTGAFQNQPMSWYGNGVRAMLGLPPEEHRFPPPPGGGPGGPGGPPGSGAGQAPGAANLAPLLERLNTDAPNYQQLTIELGGPAPALMYQTPDGQSGRIAVDPASGKVQLSPMPPAGSGKKSFAEKLVDRNQDIHEGRIFGRVGALLMMVAALSLPVFYVTGWTMYLLRRRRKRAAKQRAN